MFDPPKSERDEVPVFLTVPLNAEDWRIIVEALRQYEDDRHAQHLSTRLRRAFEHAELQPVWVAEVASMEAPSFSAMAS